MAVTGYDFFDFNAYNFWKDHQEDTEVYLTDILHWYTDILSTYVGKHQCKLLWGAAASGSGASANIHPVIDETDWTTARAVYILLCDMQGNEPNLVNSLEPGGKDYFIALEIYRSTSTAVPTGNFVTLSSQYLSSRPYVLCVSNESGSKYIHPLNGALSRALIAYNDNTWLVGSNGSSIYFDKSHNKLSNSNAYYANSNRIYYQKTSFGFIIGFVGGRSGNTIVDWPKYYDYFMLAGSMIFEMYNKTDPTDRRWCIINSDESQNVLITYADNTSTSTMTSGSSIVTNPGLVGGYVSDEIKLIPFNRGYYVNDDFYIIPTSKNSDGSDSVSSYMNHEKDFMMKNIVQVGSDHYTALRYCTSHSNKPLICMKNGEQY